MERSNLQIPSIELMPVARRNTSGKIMALLDLCPRAINLRESLENLTTPEQNSAPIKGNRESQEQ
jgi:hypothetical protein